MSEFTVGFFSTNNPYQVLGLSFTPKLQGPNGTGSPTDSVARLAQISFGYVTYDQTQRAQQCYVYSVKLTDPSQIGQAEGYEADSRDFEDATGPIPGASVRTFRFDGKQLSVDTTYYVYFPAPDPQWLHINQQVFDQDSTVFDSECDEKPCYTAQFQVVMQNLEA